MNWGHRGIISVQLRHGESNETIPILIQLLLWRELFEIFNRGLQIEVYVLSVEFHWGRSQSSRLNPFK